MRIFYDVTRLLNRAQSATPTGIDRVDIKYAYHFLKSEKYATYYIFLYKSKFYLLQKDFAFNLLNDLNKKWIESEKNITPFNKKIEEIISSYIYKSSNGSLTNDLKIDSGLLEKISKDIDSTGYYINTSHHGIGQIDAYYLFKTLGNLKIAFYLHDLIPIDYPEYVREGDDLTHQKRVNAIANFSDLVFVNSKYTKDRFIENCQKNNLPIPAIEILYIGVEDSFLYNSLDLTNQTSLPHYIKSLINGNYFIYVSTIEPRKNHIMLLTLWRQFFSSEDSPKLVILGKRGWSNEAVFNLLDRSPALINNIIELSNISDEHMVELIRNSKGFLFPSYVEGWGMPVVEALTLKVPVLASAIPSLIEASKGKAYYIDPLDAITWKNSILELVHNMDFRELLINKSSTFKAPNWNETFCDLDNILERNKDFLLLSKRELSFRAQQFKKSLILDQSVEVKNIGEKITNKAIKAVVFNTPSDSRKKLKKFLNNPHRFFKDSKKPVLKKIGEILSKI